MSVWNLCRSRSRPLTTQDLPLHYCCASVEVEGERTLAWSNCRTFRSVHNFECSARAASSPLQGPVAKNFRKHTSVRNGGSLPLSFKFQLCAKSRSLLAAQFTRFRMSMDAHLRGVHETLQRMCHNSATIQKKGGLREYPCRFTLQSKLVSDNKLLCLENVPGMHGNPTFPVILCCLNTGLPTLNLCIRTSVHSCVELVREFWHHF